MKFTIEDIKKTTLKDDEILVFRYNRDIYPDTYLQKFSDHIRKNISNKIILVPQDWDMLKIDINDCIIVEK